MEGLSMNTTINMNRLRAVILAGGRGERMANLSRLKPLALFGGQCRLIDFSLQNCKRSGIKELLLLSQFSEIELIEYLLDQMKNGHLGDLKIHFGPYQDVYHNPQILSQVHRPPENGTADALLKNAEYIFESNNSDKSSDPYEDVLILHSDHVYLFDYSKMLEFHKQNDCDLTLGHKAIPLNDVKLFGMVELDAHENVVSFIEKPQNPTSPYVFTAVCIIKKSILFEYLHKLKPSPEQLEKQKIFDVSRHIIPQLIADQKKVMSYHFADHWQDIGTLARYYRAHMDLLSAGSTLPPDLLPLTTSPDAKLKWVGNSLVAADVIEHLDGRHQISNSIICSGVRFKGPVKIENSLILNGNTLGDEAELKNQLNNQFKNQILTESGHVLDPLSTPLFIDVGGTYLRLGFLQNARVEVIRKTPAENFLRHPDLPFQELKEIFVEQLQREILLAKNLLQSQFLEISEILISFAGPVAKDGTVIAAPTLFGSDFKSWNLKQELARILADSLLGIDIFIMNDLSAAAYKYAESYSHPFMVLTVSSGIGNKIVWNGEVLLGQGGQGGELGHYKICVDPEAPICDCGGRGHLGALASARGVLRTVIAESKSQTAAYKDSCLWALSNGDPNQIDTFKIVQAVHAKDVFVRELMKDSFLALAKALSAVYQAVGVEHFIIIGGFAHALGSKYYVTELQLALEQLGSFPRTQFRIEFGDELEECLIGLASYWLAKNSRAS